MYKDLNRFLAFIGDDDDDVLVPNSWTAAAVGVIMTLGLIAMCSIGELITHLY